MNDLPRKKKRSIIDELFGNSVLDRTESLFDKSPTTGYSISVVRTPQGTEVKAKLGEDTDANTVKRQLQQQYPNAKIKIEGGKNQPLIREISTKPIKHKDKKQDQENNPNGG